MKAVMRFVTFAVVLVSVAAAQPPEPVVSLRQKMLSKETYMDLARQWLEHMKRHGETAEGHLNVGQAYRYAQEAKELWLEHYRKAVELGPKYARALDLYGCHLYHRSSEKQEKAEALQLLEKARNLDPRYPEILYSLYSVYCCEQRLDDAWSVAEDIYRRGFIPTPLQDYGYNMLAGLPQDAVLVTNGDNDTYPPVSLQAGLDHRTDVAILNQSLLGCDRYAKALEEEHSEWFPRIDRMGKPGPFKTAHYVIRELLKSKKRPVYIATTVPFDRLGDEPGLTIEGLCVRVRSLDGGKIDTDYGETLALLRDTYRLDSATNWSYPWDLRPAERMIMRNYAAVAYYAAQKALDKKDRPAAERIAEIGRKIAEFHEDKMSVAKFDELLEP
jgi:tetratricopeptide (TPR) repeat protein